MWLPSSGGCSTSETAGMFQPPVQGGPQGGGLVLRVAQEETDKDRVPALCRFRAEVFLDVV